MLVLPLANHFRVENGPKLLAMAAGIKRLKIPVVIVGVGCQASVDYDTGCLASVDDAVRQFVGAVLDRSSSIGVRGECTAAYLNRLGFSEIDVIGCPSMFMNGGILPSPKRLAQIDRHTRVSLNITAADKQDPYMRDLDRAGRFCGRAIADHDDVVFIPQTDPSISDLLFGVQREMPEHRDIPASAYGALHDQGRVVSFVDYDTWVDFLRPRDLTCGTRIHGGIAGVLASNATHILVVDSRTRELCEHFEIPHSRVSSLAEGTRIPDLYGLDDGARMVSGHARRFAEYLAFLQKNDLKNVYAGGDQGAAFEAKMAAVAFPSAIHSLPAQSPGFERAMWMREHLAHQKAVSESILREAGTLKAVVRRLARGAYEAVRR